ncbi:argininosuccinate lyase [Vulcanisaeta moutnovskia 768-28]|uniref:Argininosuccinate lyase n=1 Tax=Vulcanisaeta moutnovskia (strain 768-28) TaxID=985053 RepID=F0QTN5_VULM7|nr:lyase family protein [Vulcanisaeta moutnovskia]ADY01748.1 argininosuccinate lyase [Vulcanisaeta moutnovskia 768-28]
MYRRELLGPGSVDKISYTSSVMDDAEIFRYVIITLMVHVNELERVGVLRSDEAGRIRNALRDIWRGGYEPTRLTSYEDVHEYVEAELIRRLGSIGGWVGLGRSRNDHVATAIRLRLRDYLLDLVKTLIELRRTLLNKAIETADQLIIGSTHKQPAQVTTLGHYLLALDELTADFLSTLIHAYEVVDKSPLGTGPLAGVITPIDRVRETGELGFNGVVNNSIYATGSRYFALQTMSLVVSYLVEVGRFINNLEAWLMPQLNYVMADPSHLATSSIMPHKHNPATLEVFRARIGEAVGHLVAFYSIERPVEVGYQLDLQESTRHVWAIMRIAIEGLSILRDFIEGIRVNNDRVNEDISKYPITTAEYAEKVSISSHKPFRDVYNEVARSIRSGDIRSIMLSPLDVLSGKGNIGSPNPAQVRNEAMRRLSDVETISNWLLNNELKVKNVLRVLED